jgi:hypothetical protein
MPNWCYTSYIIEGDPETIDALDNLMSELEELPEPYVKSDFGNTWLGCLVSKLGGDWNKVRCRGSWLNAGRIRPDALSFNTETAWGPMEETIDLIREKFPGIENVWYFAEEPGMAFYVTNDESGKYWKERYIVQDLISYEEERTETLEEALYVVSTWRGWTYNSLEEAEKDEELFIKQIDIEK